MSAAKTFNVLTYDKGTVTLTPIGTRICDPQQEKAGRAEAFLAVPLYTKLYEKFKAASLPPSSGLESVIVALGVAQKQKDRARQVFQRSAKQAGFSEYGADRLVMPSVKASAPPAAAPVEELEPEKKKKTKGEDEEELHPFIQGLLKKLPPPDSEWERMTKRARSGCKQKAKWLQSCGQHHDLMYTEAEDDSKRTITIQFKRILQNSEMPQQIGVSRENGDAPENNTD